MSDTKRPETRPEHYVISEGGIDCKDAIEMLMDEHTNDPFVDHCRFHSFKYLWRLGQKDTVLKELKKARQFIDFAIERQEKLDGLR